MILLGLSPFVRDISGTVFFTMCSVCYYDLKAENNPCNKLLTMTSSKAKSLK